MVALGVHSSEKSDNGLGELQSWIVSGILRLLGRVR